MSRSRPGDPDHAPRPLVVASLIVRDEEAMLGDCLASLAGLVDEVVVCDTGSSDGTIDVARLAGAQVFEAEWQDDFAHARNVALEASRHGEWVLWIDADERLEVGDIDAARAALEELAAGSVDALLVDVVSTRADAPTSIGRATRLFRSTGLSFRGRIHEELVRDDGEMLEVSEFYGLGIRHLGYDEGRVDLDEKAERNLAVARAAFSSDPGSKAAFDLVRSLGLAGADTQEIHEAIEAGLAVAGDDPLRWELLATRAGLELSAGDAASAHATAAEVMAVVPGHDLAALVFARSSSDLERDEDLVEAFRAMSDGPTSSIRIPRHRAEATALAAAAALRVGDQEAAAAFVERAAGMLESDQGRWEVVLDALSGSPRDTAIDAVRRAAGSDRGAAATAARDRWDAAAADAIAGEGDEPIGITMDFEGERLPVDPQLLAAWLPPDRTVLEWTADPLFASAVADRARCVVSVSFDEAMALAEAADQMFDIVVGGVPTGRVDQTLDAVHRVVDAAGMLATWMVAEDGVALYPSAIAAVESGTEDAVTAERLESHGFTPDPMSPVGVRAARPAWDPTGSRTSPDTATVLHLWSEDDLADQIVDAYRAAVPSGVSVEVVAPSIPIDVFVAELPSEATVMVTAPHVVPDPRWIQACLDRTDVSAVGPRLIEESGSIVHAGWTDDGRPIGAGESGSTPMLLTDRADVALSAPYVASARAIASGEPVRGRILGSANAITVAPLPGTPAGVSLAEMFPHPVLMVGGPSPGRDQEEVLCDLEATFSELVEGGHTPVYQWADRSWEPDPAVVQRWRSAGVVAFPPSSLRREPIRFMPDPEQPRADALAAAFEPEAVVYLSESALEWDFPTIARTSIAPSIFVGSSTVARAERADVVCGSSELAARLAEIWDSQRGNGESDVPRIGPVRQEPGLVSIVIPVFNKWHLTKKCLRSIARTTERPHEIIVVDNGSTDETAQRLATMSVRVIANEENRGFPAAVNQGITAAAGEYVCVLNNDTEVTPGWLDEMLETLEIHGTGLVGPRSNRIAGLQQVPDAPPMSRPAEAATWAHRWHAEHAGASWTLSRLIGFCLLARRDTFELLGGFDEGFGIGNYEDDELGIRIQKAGMSLRVANGAVVLHHGGATFESLDTDFALLMHRARRHLGDRAEDLGGSPVTLVLADGNPMAAAAAAATAGPITDRVVIAQRGPLASTQLAAAAVRNARVEVVAGDWASDAGAREIIESLDSPLAVVMGSNERVMADEWGSARAEIEAGVGEAMGIDTAGGPEVRVISTHGHSLDLVGGTADRRLQTLELVAGAGAAAA